MKIGIDVRHGGVGGVPEYVRGLVSALLEHRQHQFILFHNSWKGDRLPFDTTPPHIKVVSTHVPNKLLNGALWLARQPKLDEYISARAGESLDVLFVPNLHFFAASKKVKVVTTAHDLSFDLMPYYYTSRARAWHRVLKPQRFFQESDAVIAVSEHTRRDLETHYKIPGEKISVVYEGISSHLEKEATTEATDLQLPERYILMMGAREARKNIHGVLQAYARLVEKDPELKSYKLLIVGSPEVEKKTREEVRRLKIDGQVIWRHHVESASREKLYRKASLLIYPSFYEGFGLPPLEAMACGIPCIVAANSASCEVAGDAALTVDPYQVGTMAHALKILLTDDILRAHYIQAGRAKSAQFTWKKAATETLEVFERVVAKP